MRNLKRIKIAIYYSNSTNSCQIQPIFFNVYKFNKILILYLLQYSCNSILFTLVHTIKSCKCIY